MMLSLLLPLVMNLALAAPKTIDLTERGHSTGMCDAQMWNICTMQLQQQAEMDGRRNLDWSCQSQRGEIVGYAPCQTFCNPPMAPPAPGPSTFVNCDSTCWGTCQLSRADLDEDAE